MAYILIPNDSQDHTPYLIDTPAPLSVARANGWQTRVIEAE